MTAADWVLYIVLVAITPPVWAGMIYIGVRAAMVAYYTSRERYVKRIIETKVERQQYGTP